MADKKCGVARQINPCPGPRHSWREMKEILTAALRCKSKTQRAAVIERFCRDDAAAKQRLLERLGP